ncbi:MAG TPA: redoxin domain-containing protein [Gemmataceae bacterium]|nr:redoxin domain-containing protein [Gemmataceae bacterium]
MRVVAIWFVSVIVSIAFPFMAHAQEPNDRAMAARASLKVTEERAPVLKVFDTGESPRELASFRPRNVVLVFFLGAECSHCTQRLRELLKATREVGNGKIEILAISSWRVPNPSAVMEMLGVAKSDRFHLLVDETHGSFRDYGCFNSKPMHGLFLIDGDGVIRVRYAGEAPFADTKEAVKMARELIAIKP